MSEKTKITDFQFPLTESDLGQVLSLNPRFWWQPEDYWAEQLWDSDCNNCKSVTRVPFDRIKEEPHIYGSPAFCTKWNKPVRCFFVGQFTAHPCFVHIRTGEVSPHKDNSVENPRYSE
jgi:hypothetical protein